MSLPLSPDLRAEIAYRAMTMAAELRHASFEGFAHLCSTAVSNLQIGNGPS